MKLARILITPIANLAEIIKATHDDDIPEMNNYRLLILDELFSYIIESIYKDLWAEGDILTVECIKESYHDVLYKDGSFPFYNINIDYNNVLEELEKAKEQLMYIIATEGLLSNMIFHTEVLSGNTIKILIYDISPITRLKKEKL